MQLGAFLKKFGKTQGEFANEIGVTQGRVSQLLQGDDPSIKLIRKIKIASGGKVTERDWVKAEAAE